MSNPQSRAHRKPPDVEEALSSMLWTPYDNNVSESDSADETEALHRINNNNNNNGSNCYSFFGSGPNQDHRRQQHQQSLMRRSLSAWSYRNRTGKSPSPGESEVGNRYSYPYYDQPELGVALGGGFSGGWYGISGNSSSATTTNNNYYYGINGSSYGYGLPVTSSRSSYSFHPELAAAAAVDPSEARAPWQTLTVSGEDRGTEKRPYLQQRQRHQQLQTPFVGRWQTGVGASQLETSSLPFSLLALDSPAAAVGGRRSTTIATDGTALVGPSGREVDGFADSYQDDYQVCAGAAGQGENMAAGSNTDSNINSINNNIDGTCSNNSLCIISAMFLEPGDSGGGGGGGVGGGNLHFPGEQQHRQGHGKSTAATPAGPQHNPSITTTTTTTTALLPLLTCGVGGRVGSPDAASIARTPPCSTAAEGSERTTTAGPASAYGSGPFTCVRQANAAASPSVRRADGFRGELDRVDQQQQQNKATSPHRVPAMRLNVPAAGLAEGSRTSVYIPSTGDGVGGGGGAGGLHPALTIQVNRLDPNNQQQNDVVNNAASGVSIVSCYRAAASVGGGGQAVPRAEDCGAAGGPKCSVPGGDRERVRGVAGEECEAAADRKRDLGELVGGVNTSDVNCSPEQMVQVSSVEERLHVAGDVGANGGGGGGGDRCPSSGPHSASPPRTFTSTEAQTDETIQQSQQLQQQQFLLQHPASAAASFIGSPTGPTGGPEPAIVTTMLGPGSEFSTREHRRRERRERRLARNRLQHIHPLEPPGPAPAGPGLLHRSPPPIEIIPDILHSHLPPPYTTLPMGASLIPQMIPANAVAAAAAAAAAIPVRAADDCRYTFPIPIMRSSPSERSRKGCCGHWFAGPPLRALIAVVALGGVACALGGAALGATGLAGSPTSHLTAALLMIGVGVILVTVSGAAWRMTAPGAPPCLGLGSTVDLGRCSRRPCGRGGSTPHGLLYPEFQHRPPPPSYQASMQEYRLRLLLLDRDRQSGRMRSTASPPPTYRSNVGSLLRIPLSSRYNNGSSNSIFGGISGIISGAVGGGSSNSVNNVPQASHADLQVNTHPYGAEGGHHGTLPPSYRSVNLQPMTTPPPPLPPPVIETLAPQPSSPSPGDANLISEDNVHPAGPQTGNKPSATGANQHHPASPSIIKIDDRRRRSSCADERNSIPNVSLIDTGANEEPPSGGGDASSSSSTSRLCNGVAAVGTAATTPAAIPTANGGSKDLVTIVTISGTIEPSAMGASRSVYTSSSSSSSNTSPGTGGGATCTLLNSNSTPLLATVIPVSKAATQTAGTGPL